MKKKSAAESNSPDNILELANKLNKKDNTVTIFGVINVGLIIMTITAAIRRHT